MQEVWVIELTVCFETGYEAAHNLEKSRYTDLMEQIDGSTHSGSLVTLEVGSCGFLSLPSFTLLKQQLLICTIKQRLLRLHSKKSKISNKSKANMEARKARSDCAKVFWRFASRLLDEDEVSASPAFSVDDAESFFKEVYSCNPNDPNGSQCHQSRTPPSTTMQSALKKFDKS